MCYWRAPERERERERESSKNIGMAKEFGHSFRSVNNNYRVLSHRLCEIGCKDTKLSANNLLFPRKINKSLRKRAGKAVSSFCGRFDLWSSLLTLGRVDASITLLSLNRRLKEFLFQPLTNGQVVEFVGTVGHEDGKYEDADGNEDVSAERGILMTIYPRHLHVDEGVVGDIDGIADFAQKSVDNR